MNLSSQNIILRYQAIQEFLKEARMVVFKYFDSPDLNIGVKNQSELVNDCDLEIDILFKNRILSQFKEDGLISEESSVISSEGEGYTWYLDPIDGTNNFCFRIPLFSTAIACIYQNKIVLSCIFNPIENKSFIAIEEQTCILKSNQEHIVHSVDLGHSLQNSYTAGYTSLDSNETANTLLQDILYQAKGKRVLGSTALELSFVAIGALGVFVCDHYRLFDVLAGVHFALNRGCYVYPRNILTSSTDILFVVQPKLIDEISIQTMIRFLEK